MKNFVKTFENFDMDMPHGMLHQMDEPSMGHDQETQHYMFFGNLETIHRLTGQLLQMNPMQVDKILKNGHDWANEHIATAKDDIEEVANFLINEVGGMDGHHDGDQVFGEAYMCNECGKMYEEEDLTEDMSCNECGSTVSMVTEEW